MRLSAAILVATLAPAAHAAEFRSVGEAPAVLFDAPSQKADRQYVASRGYPFEVLVRLEQWTKVRDASGEVAWIENRLLGDRRTALVSAPVSDIREAPSAGAPLVFEAKRQVILEVLEPPSEGWVRVRHRDGQTGYARTTQLWGV